MLLFDTHLILWAAFEPERLLVKAARQLRSRETPLAFSPASLWEVAIKSSRGRPEFVVDCQVLHQGLLNQGFVELPIQAAHISRAVTLPWVHRDPFDRLLVAQAMVERLSLLTSDAVLKGCDGHVVDAVARQVERDGQRLAHHAVRAGSMAT